MKLLRILVVLVAVLAVDQILCETASAQLCTGSTDDHVFYIDTNSQVAELCQSQSSGSWYLSLSGIGEGAAGLGASFYANGQEHVIYDGQDEHVWQLYSSGGTWANQDLTAATGAPNPAGGTASYVNGSVYSVFEVTTADHIVQLSYNGAWSYSDLTTLAGAPLSAAYSPLTSYVVANILYVTYRSSAEHVVQLYYNGSWHYQDLTALIGTGATLDVSGLTSDYDNFNGNQDVYYLTSGGVGGAVLFCSVSVLYDHLQLLGARCTILAQRS